MTYSCAVLVDCQSLCQTFSILNNWLSDPVVESQLLLLVAGVNIAGIALFCLQIAIDLK